MIKIAVLTHDEILKEIRKGSIQIWPFDPTAIGPASVDLTLDDKFRIFTKGKVFDVKDDSDYKQISKMVQQESMVVKPGEVVLGITKEKITLSENISGWLEGRSRFARLGLLVHISASFMQPGISNHQVLEIVNLGHRPLRLHAGTKICQFIFQKTEGKAKYRGQFREQISP